MEITDIHSFLKYWERVKDRSRTLFAVIPPDKIEWTYEPGKFTLGDTIRHLALIERFMHAECVQGKPSQYEGCSEDYAKGYDAILKLYDDLHDEATDIFSRLTPEQLNAKCRAPGGHAITVWKLLRSMVEHEIHHRGMLYVYLNLLHVQVPPVFGFTSEQVIEFKGVK